MTTFKLAVLLYGSSLIYHSKIDIAYIIKSYFFIPAINVDNEILPLLGVGWTLNFEMFFYLMFALSLAFRINSIWFLSLIFFPLAILSFFSTPNWPDVRFYANPIVLDFLYGMIVAQLILIGKKLPKNISIFFIVAGLLYLFFPKIEALSFLYWRTNIITGLAAFLVIYGCASIEHVWGPKPAWLIYLGGASYSLYLIHPIIAPAAPTILKHLHFQSAVVSVIFGVLLALAAGTAFYKFCENPLTKVLTKWAKQKRLI